MKLLLIDDHALFREGVALLLASLAPDTVVLEAESFEQAIELLGSVSDVDIVLIDLQLPGLSGLEGIRVLRERYPALPVVAVSSSDDKDTVLGVLDAGAMGFIPKTSSSSVLKGALTLVLSKSIYLPPAVFLADSARIASSRSTEAADPSTPLTPASLGLSKRQSDVLQRILEGKSAKLISRDLGLSASTVKAHTSAVLRALNVTTRTQAVVEAGKLGLRFTAG